LPELPVDTASDRSEPEPAERKAGLAVTGITVRFGGLTALAKVSIDVEPGTIVGLVGPNGAGKSTLFAAISGLVRPSTGRVSLAGRDVTALSPQARARLGLARTFQHPELFTGMTVRDHLILADRIHYERRRCWSDLIKLRALFPPSRLEGERVAALLDLLGLTKVAKAQVSVLPLGLARLVEVGRALAMNPKVLLLDEPLSGMDVRATENLLSVLERVVSNSDQGLSLLLVEHDVASVLALASSIYVLNFGELIASGSPDEVRANPSVRDAYLGDEDVTAGEGTPSGARP
jgi:ABC-type branched-subunit amino acid transport system ATPase component